jgi:hypothetical protein
LYWTIALAVVLGCLILVNARGPAHAAGRNCANCQLHQGKAGEAWAACAAADGKLVNAKG